LKYRPIITGAGIIGASIAWQLAERGRDPIVLEQSAAPATGISGESFGWINAYNAADPGYFRFRLNSMGEFLRLPAHLQRRLGINWNGSLVWTHAGSQAQELVQRLQAWGYPMRLLDSTSVWELEPNLRCCPDTACFAENEGSIDPVAMTRALLDEALRHGAELRTGCAASAIVTSGDSVIGIETSNGHLACRDLILAAGWGSAALAGPAGIALPAVSSEALLVETQPLPPVISRLLAAPGVRLWQGADGAIRACDEFDGCELAPRSAPLAQELLQRVERLLDLPARLQTRRVTVGTRMVPADGLPVIGRPAVPVGLYIAVMHSGVTLAPLVGRLAASEICTGSTEESLSPYRPGRPSLC
jgi:glycine/D-amino acid oxidase-like deaminating enzyme